MSEGRSTTVRDRDRKAIARTKPPCGICEEPIDYALPHMDPMAFVVDHVIPLASARTIEDREALDVLANKQAAHRVCNRLKSDKTPDDLAPRQFVTERVW